jgi:hypothetical protein
MKDNIAQLFFSLPDKRRALCVQAVPPTVSPSMRKVG